MNKNDVKIRDVFFEQVLFLKKHNILAKVWITFTLISINVCRVSFRKGFAPFNDLQSNIREIVKDSLVVI